MVNTDKIDSTNKIIKNIAILSILKILLKASFFIFNNNKNFNLL